MRFGGRMKGDLVAGANPQWSQGLVVHADSSRIEELRALLLANGFATDDLADAKDERDQPSGAVRLGHVRSAVDQAVHELNNASTAVTGNLIVAAAATFVTSGASAIAKASLDASLQDDLPEESRASAFGRSESVLQLAWVLGGAIGVLVYTDLWVGFTAITALLIPGLAQTVVSYRGASLIPGFGGNRPVLAEPEGLSAVTHR